MSHNQTKENQAKDTLAFISDFDNLNQPFQWNQQCFTYKRQSSKKPIRLLLPIRNKKNQKNYKLRNINSQLNQRGRTVLVPCKVSLQNQKVKSQKIEKVNKNTQQNLKPYKTYRNFYSLTRKVQQKFQQHQIDYMQYWIKHRFQKGSITSLFDKLKQKKASGLRL